MEFTLRIIVTVLLKFQQTNDVAGENFGSGIPWDITLIESEDPNNLNRIAIGRGNGWGPIDILKNSSWNTLARGWWGRMGGLKSPTTYMCSPTDENSIPI
jgi:hypothetical protein